MIRRLLLVAVVMLLVTACGGGGDEAPVPVAEQECMHLKGASPYVCQPRKNCVEIMGEGGAQLVCS